MIMGNSNNNHTISVFWSAKSLSFLFNSQRLVDLGYPLFRRLQYTMTVSPPSCCHKAKECEVVNFILTPILLHPTSSSFILLHPTLHFLTKVVSYCVSPRSVELATSRPRRGPRVLVQFQVLNLKKVENKTK